MAIEYIYWCIVSNMGILDDTQTCIGIDNEWELCTPELFESTDTMMFNLITDPQHQIPQNAPDGNYCPFTGVLGDFNNDSTIDILDVLVMINIVLGQEPFTYAADLNGDDVVNMLDIVLLVNLILEP